MKKVVELKLCRICLRKHPDKQCNCKLCVKCSRSHNILLHFPSRNTTVNGVHNHIASEDNATKQNIKSSSTTNTSISTHVSFYNVREQVLLPTAIVNVRNDRDIGDSQRCRMLLDSGSQCNLITKNMVQSLRLKKKRINHSIMGIGNIPQTITSSVIVSVRSLYNQFTLQDL